MPWPAGWPAPSWAEPSGPEAWLRQKANLYTSKLVSCDASPLGRALFQGRPRRDDCRTPRPTCESGLCGHPVMMRQGKAMAYIPNHETPGARFRAALAAEKPLQVVGAINAYAARLAEATGFRAIYLSGGGVAANSLGIPDLGISGMEDVLIDVRRITDACPLPLLVDIDTGWGGAFNIARTIRQMIKVGAAAVHIEDQVSAKRCGHRPGKELVPAEEMVDRIKAAVDARTDSQFVIMARTDALAGEGLDKAIARSQAYVAAGADMIFAEAVTELPMYTAFRKAVGVPILANITEFGKTPLFTREELAA